MLFAVRPAQAAAVEATWDGATVVGTVLDADTAEPLAGALVQLTELERVVVTDANGRYALRRVPPGPHHITVRFVGYAQRTLHALVPPDGTLEINVSLAPKPLRIQTLDVRAPISVRGLEGGDSTAFPDREISIAAVRNHPLLSEPEVFQALGGGDVVLRPESPSGVHVRGGATDHTAYLIDGIPVFSPYHAAGVSSAWNPDALSRLHLASSAPSVANPHTLSGALDAVTRVPGDQFRAQGTVSTTQARLTLDGPLGVGESGYLLSLRSGFAGLIPRKKEGSHLKGETGDWLAKIEGQAFGGRVRFLGYDSQNEIDAASTTGPEDTPGPPPPRNAFDWQSRSLGAEWRRAFATTAVRVMGWSAFGDAGSRWAAQVGPVRMTADRRDEGFLADVELRSASAATVAGLRVERSRTRYRIDSDSVAVPDWRLDARTPVAAVFAQHTRGIGRRVEIGLGASLAGAEDDLHPGPRARLRWHLSNRLTLSGGYGRTHQFIQSLRNAESVVGTVFPVDLYMGAGAPGVPVARSDQGVVAADFRPTAGVRLTLQAYARGSDGVLLVAPREGEPFTTRAFAVGSGTSRGASIDAALSAARYGIVASYGFQRVRLEYGDSSYVPEHGARHLFEGGVIVFPTPAFSVRLGAAAAWGRRTTTALGEFEWEACNLLDQGCEFGGSPHYGGEPLGGTALPAYYRVDLGVQRHWHFDAGGRDVSIALFGTVTNILGRRNVLTYARDPSTGDRVAIEMRPRAPLVVGLDWRF